MIRTKTSRPAIILTSLSSLLFFYGFYLGGVQLVVADISANYGMHLTGIGLLASAQQVLAIFMPIIFGSVADRFGKKRVLFVFSSLFGVGCLLSSVSNNLRTYLLGALLIGAAYSVCESISSAVLADIDDQKAPQYINISQGVLSFGAVLSPIILQHLLQVTGSDWRLVFRICSLAFFSLAVLISCITFPVAKPSVNQKRTSSAVPNCFSSEIFVCLFFAVILYCGLETGISYFIESLFGQELHHQNLGPYAISFYWIGMTLSRFVVGSRQHSPFSMLLAFFASSTISLTLLGISNNSILSLVLFAVAGFSYGPIWSTLVAMAAALFPSSSAGATGIMSAGSGLGSLVYPVIMGAIADRFQIRSAFFFLSLTALLGFTLCFAASKKQTNKAKNL